MLTFQTLVYDLERTSPAGSMFQTAAIQGSQTPHDLVDSRPYHKRSTVAGEERSKFKYARKASERCDSEGASQSTHVAVAAFMKTLNR